MMTNNCDDAELADRPLQAYIVSLNLPPRMDAQGYLGPHTVRTALEALHARIHVADDTLRRTLERYIAAGVVTYEYETGKLQEVDPAAAAAMAMYVAFATAISQKQ